MIRVLVLSAKKRYYPAEILKLLPLLAGEGWDGGGGVAQFCGVTKDCRFIPAPTLALPRLRKGGDNTFKLLPLLAMGRQYTQACSREKELNVIIPPMLLRDYYSEFRIITRLSIPLIISLVAEIGIQLTNSVMMGYLGTAALAAGALGIGISLLVNMAMLGVTNAAGIFIASAYGAEEYDKIPHYWQQCLYLCIGLTILLSFLYLHFGWILQQLHQAPQVVQLTQQYLWGEMWGIFPVFGFWLFKEVSATLEKTTFIMIVAILGLPLNALLDYLFIFGKGIFPQWGMYGIGFSGSIVYWIMFALLMAYGLMHSKLAPIIRKRWGAIHWRQMVTLLKMAWPISCGYFFEAGLFSAASVMMGWVSIDAQAAHQIVFQYIDVNYMIFLGISQIAGLRIATYYGAEDKAGIHRSMVTATVLTVLTAGNLHCCLFEYSL